MFQCTPIEPLLLENNNNNNTSKTDEFEKLTRDINFHTFINKSNSLSRSFLDGPSQIKVLLYFFLFYINRKIYLLIKSILYCNFIN